MSWGVTTKKEEQLHTNFKEFKNFEEGRPTDSKAGKMSELNNEKILTCLDLDSLC